MLRHFLRFCGKQRQTLLISSHYTPSPERSVQTAATNAARQRQSAKLGKKRYRRALPINAEKCFGEDCICIGNLTDPFGMLATMKAARGEIPNANVVKVFHSEDEKNVEIVMLLYGSTRTVQRCRTEPLCKSLERIKTNVKNANAKLSRKSKKKVKTDTPLNNIFGEAAPTVTLYDAAGEQIDDQLEIIDGWEKGETLKICDVSYRVVCNPPKVESVKLVRMPIVGIPIYPQLQFRMATIENSRFQWYRRLCPEREDDIAMDTDDRTEVQAGKHKMDSSDCESVDANNETTEEWELVGEDKTYIASVNDVGYTIRLKIYPGSVKYPQDSKVDFHRELVFATTEGTVIKGPEKLLFDERVKHTVNRCKDGSFRFICYNILADVYASTEYAHDFLFPYCPAEALDIDYRQQLILKEIIGYNADVICLQEVDRSVFESYFMPAMSLQGFAGAFAAKEGIKEGVCLFYRREKFKLIMVENLILRRVFQEDRNKDLYEKIASNESMMKNFMGKPTCLLIGLLQSIEDSSKKILVGNTHLYWHPHGCHIRLIQVELLLREMRRFYAKYSEKESSSKLSCIVTGDFNSNPYSGAVKLITDGEVPSNHADWFSLGKAEYLTEMTLKNPTAFKSACGFPAYTNYVTRFQNSLDYIFIDDSLKVEKVIPQPSHEDVVLHTALPNVSCPSDHIAQVVDLSWKT